MPYDELHTFKKEQLIHIFDECINKTLGEVDKKKVFNRTISNPKITGIAGDVIEQSVLGYPADQRQEPDLLVDGIKVELKTTGIRESKKAKEKSAKKKTNEYQSELLVAESAPKYGSSILYEAKEPMSITAVSPKTIVNEIFDESNFWHKLEHLLLVYYLYDSNTTVIAAEYANFPIKGYEFHKFSEIDKSILHSDWQIVHDFIVTLQKNYPIPENEYPRISHDLRDKLMYIDTAPKWPNPPRFRLKRSFVTTIVQNYFGTQTEVLPEKVSKFADIDNRCKEIEKKYAGLTVKELAAELNIQTSLINKSIGERLVIKMFSGTSGKMNDIDIFKKSGLLGKTIVLTSGGKGTEDFKFFAIDFDEIKQPDLEFEDSSFYKYFAEHMFLCVIFQEPYKPASGKTIPLEQNKFIGFKRIIIDEDFIQTEVKKTWLEIRDLVINNKLVDVIERDKFGNPKINKTGVVSSAPNFPKSKTNAVFVRGTSADSTVKNECVNGIRMYVQDVWISRKVFLEIINK